jgi:COP9 signalosome complex subunit 6
MLRIIQQLCVYAKTHNYSEVDIEVHKQMVRYTESPLFIVLNPAAAVGAKDLPVSIYEGEVHNTITEQGNTVTNTIFVPQQFQLQTAQVRYMYAL